MAWQLEKKVAELRAADQKQKQMAKRIDELQAVRLGLAAPGSHASFTALNGRDRRS